MTIDYTVIVKDVLTWATAAKVVAGGVIHKVWTWVYAKYLAAKAEAAKLEAEAKAEAAKLEAEAKADIKKL